MVFTLIRLASQTFFLGLLMYEFFFLLADEPGGVCRLHNVRASVKIEYYLINCMHVLKSGKKAKFIVNIVIVSSCHHLCIRFECL